MDFVTRWSEKCEQPAPRLVAWLGMRSGKFYAWRQSYGAARESGQVVPRDHWLEVNVATTFFYLCTILDGYSRAVVHRELRESMREVDVEIVLQRARERFPAARPRIISDNGPQFIARDFKSFLRIAGMTHVRTSPNYPQSPGRRRRRSSGPARPFYPPAAHVSSTPFVPEPVPMQPTL